MEVRVLAHVLTYPLVDKPKVTITARRGDVVTLPEEMAARALRLGLVADPDAPVEVAETPAATTSGEDQENPTTSAPGGKPARTAPVDEWRDFATRAGLKVKGLSKREIIAAVNTQL